MFSTASLLSPGKASGAVCSCLVILRGRRVYGLRLAHLFRASLGLQEESDSCTKFLRGAIMLEIDPPNSNSLLRRNRPSRDIVNQTEPQQVADLLGI